MKKYFSGLLAITVALGAVAFTRPSPKPAFTNYYFRLDAAGMPQTYQKSGNNVPWTAAQAGCTDGSQHCEAAFPGFQVSGSGPYTYSATGTQVPDTETKKD